MPWRHRVTMAGRLDLMDEIEKRILTLETSMATTKEKVDEHHGSLYGNGKEGLVTAVVKLRQVMKAAVWIGGVICVLMVTDFFSRFSGTQPKDVKARVEHVHEDVDRIEKKLDSVMKAVKESE